MPRGSKPALSPEQDQKVEAAYATGKSAAVIAAEMGVTQRIILSSLDRSGVKRRTHTDYGWSDTPETRAEIVRLFHDGLSVQNIGRRVKTRNDNVSRVLHDAGINPRYGGSNKRFTDAQIEQLILEHESGASFKELARRYGGSDVVVRNTLRRAGIATTYERRKKFWTSERLDWLQEQWRSGRSQSDIATELNYSQSAIGRKLRDIGCIMPTPQAKGAAHGSWKGGRVIDSGGYVRVVMSNEDRHLITRTISGGYVLEHRLVVARALGRPLTKSESVHHINGVRDDNRLENLQLRQGAHGKGVRMVCIDCGSHNVAANSLA